MALRETQEYRVSDVVYFRFAGTLSRSRGEGGKVTHFIHVRLEKEEGGVLAWTQSDWGSFGESPLCNIHLSNLSRSHMQIPASRILCTEAGMRIRV